MKRTKIAIQLAIAVVLNLSISTVFAQSQNALTNSGNGYEFNFSSNHIDNCYNTSNPPPYFVGTRKGYSLSQTFSGSMKLTADGTQTGDGGWQVELHDNSCKTNSANLSQNVNRVVEMRVKSSVNVPQVLCLPIDEQFNIGDKNADIKSLVANQWTTLTFDISAMANNSTNLDASKIRFVWLAFRNAWNDNLSQFSGGPSISGTFEIDYIKIGDASSSVNPNGDGGNYRTNTGKGYHYQFLHNGGGVTGHNNINCIANFNINSTNGITAQGSANTSDDYFNFYFDGNQGAYGSCALNFFDNSNCAKQTVNLNDAANRKIKARVRATKACHLGIFATTTFNNQWTPADGTGMKLVKINANAWTEVEFTVPATDWQNNILSLSNCGGITIGVRDYNDENKVISDVLLTIDWIKVGDAASCNQVAITQQPSNISECPGADVLFTVTASNASTYAWKKEGDNTVLSNSPTFNIYDITSSNFGNYYVEVSNNCGSTTSNKVSLSQKSPSPSFTSQPSNQSVCVGKNLSITLNVSNTTNYKWYNTKDNDVVISTSSTLSFNPVQQNDFGSYYVTIGNDCGSSTSNIFTITEAGSISINSQPQNVSACIGNNASFIVSASNASSYAWKKQGNNTVLSTSASLSLTNVSSNDLGNYFVEVSNSCNTVTSNVAQLSKTNAVAITSQPTPVSACINGSATLTVSATDANSYAWKKQGNSSTLSTTNTLNLNNISNSDFASYYVEVSNTCGTITSNIVSINEKQSVQISQQPSSVWVCEGTSTALNVLANNATNYSWKKVGDNTVLSTSSTLSFSQLSSNDFDDYYVDVVNSCGTVSSSIATINKKTGATITSQPTSKKACVGDQVNFFVQGVNASGYEWKKDGSNAIVSNGSNLNFNSITNSDFGTYYAVVKGACGDVNSVKVTLSPSGNLVNITTQPQSSQKCLNESAALSFTTAGAVNHSIYWKKVGGNTSIGTQNTLTLNNLKPTDFGKYYAELTTSCGVQYTDTAEINSKEPIVSIQPVDETACEGDNKTFSFIVSNNVNYSAIWKKVGNNNPIGTGNSFPMSNITKANYGKYYAVLTSSCGSQFTDTAELINKGAFITKQPKNEKVCEGGNVSLSFDVDQSKNISVAWKKLGNSATLSIGKTLDLSPATKSTFGKYYAEVSSLCGKVYTDTTEVIDCNSQSNGIIENDVVNYRVYPNPTHSMMFIEGNFVSYDLYDARGLKVLSGEKQNGIDVSNLNQGIYLVVIQNSNHKVYTQRIMIRH